MLAVLGLAPLITTFSSPQLAPLSLSYKRARVTAVLSNTTNSHVGQATLSNRPPVAIPHAQGLWPITDSYQPSSSAPLPPDISRETQENGTVNGDTSHPPAAVGSIATGHPSTTSFPVSGPFDLLDCIQTGGFGTAYAAKDRSTGRILCLKIFEFLQHPDTLRSVRTELRAFRRMVNSDGGKKGRSFIMELGRSIQHGQTVFFAMELMTTDLCSYFVTEPERCKLHARRWTAQIALAIDSLHEMGIIHRDVKPENILIDPRENVRIIDFGFSFMGHFGIPLHSGLGYTVEYVGTMSYMAPEVLQIKRTPAHRRQGYGPAIDWWAVGCILFELESWDHQLLFDTQEDLITYTDWTKTTCLLEAVYPRFGDLEPVVVNLIEGLLNVRPTHRYCMRDLEKHAYFLRQDGTSEFENAAARALERPIRSGLVPRFEDSESIEVVEAAKMKSKYDWVNESWSRW